ncbi:hypothetical protein BpHYR1_028082 [Brachionus plicatilis]|uniref:Uncharacterized protein n=1 Tax=Brachionus plicatilis TaxID=10195 RepID=A0A3M7QNK2_BRAPC|nr:hypothetical protein BpHYR1_028082 [Brachionus plicatilis]
MRENLAPICFYDYSPSDYGNDKEDTSLHYIVYRVFLSDCIDKLDFLFLISFAESVCWCTDVLILYHVYLKIFVSKAAAFTT